MAQVFFPIRWIDVPASPPHEGNPSYRVSFGIERWAGGPDSNYVYKVQMAYDGAVAGRKSPSFPANTDDLDRVQAAMRQVKAGEGKSGRGQIAHASMEPD